uniref:Uncharacterized protein n=1 Tax=Anopheles farauti TaxID=69004 RepID=A0A182QL58_9DIPT
MLVRIVLGWFVLVVAFFGLTTADFIPWLIVPETAPTRHQLISGIGIPVGTPESITSGWVMKAQYFLPTKVDDLKPQLWENWNDSRRALGRRDVSALPTPVPIVNLPVAGAGRYERYEVRSVPMREESLDSAPEDGSDEEFDDGDDSYWTDEEDDRILQQADASGLWPAAKEIDPDRSLDGYSAERSRWTTYRAMEKLSESYGLPGRACVLRSVCESAAAPFTHTGGIFAELLHIVFSPSTTTEPVSEHRDNEYFRAEQLGRTGAPCERIFPECVHSLLDIFTGVHDPETDTMHLLHDQVRAYLMRKTPNALRKHELHNITEYSIRVPHRIAAEVADHPQDAPLPVVPVPLQIQLDRSDALRKVTRVNGHTVVGLEVVRHKDVPSGDDQRHGERNQDLTQITENAVLLVQWCLGQVADHSQNAPLAGVTVTLQV